MPQILKTQLPPPSNEEDFEDLCESIAKEYWSDNTASRYGNRGHEQFGVDIFVPIGLEGNKRISVAVQCKKKKRSTNRKLSETDILDTLDKIKNFPQPVDKVVIATTGAKDPKIQDVVFKINVERDKVGDSPVEVWFWEDIEKTLITRCTNCYLQYLESILPQDGKSIITNELLKSSLLIAEDNVRDNLTEVAEGAAIVLKNAVMESDNSEIKGLFHRLLARINFKKGAVEEGQQELNSSMEELGSDVESYGILFDHQISEGGLDAAKETLGEIEKIAPNNPLTRNSKLILQFYQDESLEFLGTNLPGLPKENAPAYFVLHLYADSIDNIEKRTEYLEAHKLAVPNSPITASYEIIYSIHDLFRMEDSVGIKNIDELLVFIEKKQSELKLRNPLSKVQELILEVELLKLDSLICHRFSPNFERINNRKNNIIQLILNQHVSHSVLMLTTQLLHIALLDREEISAVIDHIKRSKKQVGDDLGNSMLSQCIAHDESLHFASDACSQLELNEQSSFLGAVRDENLQDADTFLRKTNLAHTIALLSSIDSSDFLFELIELQLKFRSGENTEGLEHLKLCVLMDTESASLHTIKSRLELEKQSFPFLDRLATRAQERQQWDLEAECLKVMCGFDLDSNTRDMTTLRLSLALFRLEDFSGVLDLMSNFGSDLASLHPQNQMVAIRIWTQCCLKLHNNELALEIAIKARKLFPKNAEFLFIKALFEQKSENYQQALEDIVAGFRVEENVTVETFRNCFAVLVELANAGLIKNEDKESVDECSYVKITELDTWFYTGEGESIDAVRLEANDPRFLSIYGKPIDSEIDWPPDKYHSRRAKKKIQHIVGEPAYLSIRAHEAIYQASEDGSAPIWTMGGNTPDENIKNIKAFLRESQKKSEDIYANYAESPLPFSFICKLEGGIGEACKQISIRRTGFIHINDGSIEGHKQQLENAHETIRGKPVFIDSLSFLFLFESGLLATAIKSIPDLRYTPSVVASTLEYADNFAKSPFQAGRLGFGSNMEMNFSDYDHNAELEIKNNLLSAIKMLEMSATKETSDYISAKKVDLEREFPSGITDPHAAARAHGTDIITDDFYYSRSIEFLSGEEQPRPISSIALAQALYDLNLIAAEQFYIHQELLLIYRCKHITISANIIMRSIIVEDHSGIARYNPKNVRKLMLGFTLSNDYGVSAELASEIIAAFLSLVVEDGSITPITAEEIVAEFLVETMRGRDRHFGFLCYSKLNELMKADQLLIIPSARRSKLSLIKAQITSYFEEFNPLYDSIPALLAKTSRPK